MMWKGKELTKMIEVFEAALECKNKKEASEFLQTYVRSGVTEDVAKSNLGYFAGYYDKETSKKIYDLFGAAHPIFGQTWPTPEEAFKMGVKLGEKAKKAKAP